MKFATQNPLARIDDQMHHEIEMPRTHRRGARTSRMASASAPWIAQVHQQRQRPAGFGVLPRRHPRRLQREVGDHVLDGRGITIQNVSAPTATATTYQADVILISLPALMRKKITNTPS